MSELMTVEQNDQSTNRGQTINSREVAKMTGKRHDHLLRDIAGYLEAMRESIDPKIGVNEFFLQSQYVDAIGRTLPCYDITRKGCEMIAHKMTGTTGIQFTAAYINLFHEMEGIRSIQTSELSPELQMFKCLYDSVAAAQLEQAAMKKQLATVTEKADAAAAAVTNIRDIFTERDDDWRAWQNDAFNKAVHNSPGKDYQAMRRDTYEELERRAGCDLTRRLSNLKRRLYESGASKSRIGAATRIDVIEEDTRIKEIYGTIIKELSMRYSIGQA